MEESKQQLINFPKHLKNIAEKGRKKRSGKKESVETRRERKAWRTLAIITVSFLFVYFGRHSDPPLQFLKQNLIILQREHSFVVGLLSLFFPSTVHSV